MKEIYKNKQKPVLIKKNFLQIPNGRKVIQLEHVFEFIECLPFLLSREILCIYLMYCCVLDAF